MPLKTFFSTAFFIIIKILECCIFGIIAHQYVFKLRYITLHLDLVPVLGQFLDPAKASVLNPITAAVLDPVPDPAPAHILDPAPFLSSSGSGAGSRSGSGYFPFEKKKMKEKYPICGHSQSS